MHSQSKYQHSNSPKPILINQSDQIYLPRNKCVIEYNIRPYTNPLAHSLTSAEVSDQQAITELLHGYGAVLASRSLPDLLSIYTSDGVLMAPGFQPAVGSEALKASYERIFSTIKLDIKFSIDEIIVMDGKWAFARTTAEGRKFWLQKGTDEFHHNQEIFICQKVDSAWKIARYCFSSMKPLV